MSCLKKNMTFPTHIWQRIGCGILKCIESFALPYRFPSGSSLTSYSILYSCHGCVILKHVCTYCVVYMTLIM